MSEVKAPTKLNISLEWGRPKVTVTVDGLTENRISESVGASQLPALLNSIWTEWALRCAEAIDPQAAAEFRKYAMAAGGAPEPESIGAGIGADKVFGQASPFAPPDQAPMLRKRAARTFALNEAHTTHVPKRDARRKPAAKKSKKTKRPAARKRR